jgi:hypothetical protein
VRFGAAKVERTSDDLRDIEAAASKIAVQEARLPKEIPELSCR